MKKIVRQLEKIINKHGVEYLERNPYEVYSELAANGIDAAYARLVLITILSGTSVKALELDTENLSENIQKECYLQKDAADEMSSMYHLLFSKKNITRWKKRENYGFLEFCGRSWEINWDGHGTWNTGNGHIECWCDITADIAVSDKKLAKQAVSHLLEENPFTPAEEIFEFFFQEISDVLDVDLKDYITGDSYYPPVMDDYDSNGKEVLSECCKKFGLNVLTFECDGSESDYEPDYMQW